MKRSTINKFTAVSVLVLCVFLAGCGCGKKKSDPASRQVLKISITPEATPTLEPEKINKDAVVTNDGITMINEYLVNEGGSGAVSATEPSGEEKESENTDSKEEEVEES